jgi:hypothetical protein
MHQCADIYLLQRQTLHVLGVTAPVLRSSKNCICYLWYRSWYWYCYFLQPWPDSSNWSFLLTLQLYVLFLIVIFIN